MLVTNKVSDTLDHSYRSQTHYITPITGMTAKGAADLKGSSFGLLQDLQSCWSIGAPQLSCTDGFDPLANTSLQSWGGAYPPTYKPDVMQCSQGVLYYRRYTAEEFHDDRGKGGGKREHKRGYTGPGDIGNARGAWAR